ncbi:UNVERIFIED_CONTAM: hypothetical protein B566_EDAN018806 [Ephemera danica]|nr:hypothetical protein B566_EDAN018806 [Ephemera danica]
MASQNLQLEIIKKVSEFTYYGQWKMTAMERPVIFKENVLTKRSTTMTSRIDNQAYKAGVMEQQTCEPSGKPATGVLKMVSSSLLLGSKSSSSTIQNK